MLIRSRGARWTRLLPWAVGCPHHARCTPPPPSSSSPGVRGSKHSARSPPESLVDEGVGLCRVVRVVCMGDRETSAGTDAPLLAYFVEPPPACLDPKDSAGARERGVRWEKAHRGSGWWGSLSPPVLLQALGGIQPHSGPGSPADPASEDTPPLASGLGRCRNPGFSKDSLEDKGSGSVDTGEPCLPPLLHPQLQNLEATGQWGKTTGPGSVRPSTRLPRAVLGLVTLRSRGGQRLGLTRAFWQPSPCPPPLRKRPWVAVGALQIWSPQPLYGVRSLLSRGHVQPPWPPFCASNPLSSAQAAPPPSGGRLRPGGRLCCPMSRSASAAV